VGALARFADRARAQFATAGALWTTLRARVGDGGDGLFERVAG
jgi:hypothetical protein